MVVHTFLPVGQQQARTRWGTHASGEDFDRKKASFLTAQAQDFIAQQGLCVIAGLDCQDKVVGLLAFGTPGFVETPDEHTCLLHLHPDLGTSRILQGLRQSSWDGKAARLGLFFISHPTRERLCVHGTAEILPGAALAATSVSQSHPSIGIWLHVQQSFFHCSKYIKTRIPGLTCPAQVFQQHARQLEHLHGFKLPCLAEPICDFIAEQLLCFLCTAGQDGQPVVNHRGGAPGFLVALPPDATSPGGIVLLPDYAGNGAFEAIGNIIETGKAAFVIPDYVAQLAVCISGSACILEIGDLSPELAERCTGAERVVALSVECVEVQRGDWCAALAYEIARTQTLPAIADSGEICTV